MAPTQCSAPFSLSLQKDHPWRRETVKGALMVMYSCVASHCHPQMLLTHADNPIASKIIHHYTSSCQVTPGRHTPAPGAWGLPASIRAVGEAGSRTQAAHGSWRDIRSPARPPAGTGSPQLLRDRSPLRGVGVRVG